MRGMIVHGDYIWYVIGTSLRKQTFAGVDTLVGTVSGTALCNMVGAGLNQIVIVDGTNHYLATTSSVTSITPPAGAWCDVAWLDGYSIYVRKDTDEFYASELDDPTTVGALNFSTADGQSDVLIGCETSHRELILFGKKHIEFWYNAGGAGFPMARTSPGLADRGCYAARSIAKYNETVFFLGDDRSVYRLDGYRPVRVSSDYIDLTIRSFSTITEAQVGAGTYVDTRTGQAYYELSLGYDSTNHTAFSYNINTGAWHVKRHNGMTLPRFVDYANCVTFNGYRAIAAVNTTAAAGDVYMLDSNSYTDQPAGATLTNRILVTPFVEFGGRRFIVHEVRLNALPTSGGTVSMIMTYDAALASRSRSAISTYTDPIKWSRLGQATRCNFLFNMSASATFTIDGVRALIEVMDA
jgi:hypothetical protein